MKSCVAVLVLFLCSLPLAGQQLPIWSRVYTFDESFIEVNTRQIVVSDQGIGHATFRWTFDQPEPYARNQRIKYKTRLEVIEFDCGEKKIRPYDVTYLVVDGKAVAYEGMLWLRDWNSIDSPVMLTLYQQACMLIKPPAPKPPEIRRAASFAVALAAELKRTQDFAPVIAKFFAANYIDGYLRDGSFWFLNLNQDVAEGQPPGLRAILPSVAEHRVSEHAVLY